MKIIYLAFLATLITLCIAKKTFSTLPGYNGPNLNMTTGYITVNEKLGRNYFYWFVESQNNPWTDPLVIWYTGGPGCSGLLGLFLENGPMKPDNNGGVEYNPLSWTKVANVLYLEQPAGVGFSYSNTSEGYNYGDWDAAEENYQFLEKWLLEFPAYQGRSTWLTGESYAGVYIPTLTYTILANPSSIIANQLVGFLVGNPVMSCTSINANTMQLDMYYWHGLMSYRTRQNWTKSGCDADFNLQLPICIAIFNQASIEVGSQVQPTKRQQVMQPSLNPDDLYDDFCLGNGTLDFAATLGYPDDCNSLPEQVTEYLNRKDVQEIIGSADMVWYGCAPNTSQLNYNSSGESMMPIYEAIFSKSSLQILVYSGDIDIATVPFGGTEGCLAELNETPVAGWQPWFVNTATAGYVETYEHYSFATIKGAGHEAPLFQPLIAYEMFTRFISTGSLMTGNERRAAPKRVQTQGDLLRRHGIKV